MLGSGWELEIMVTGLGVSGTQRRAALCGLWHRVMGIPSGSCSSYSSARNMCSRSSQAAAQQGSVSQ